MTAAIEVRERPIPFSSEMVVRILTCVQCGRVGTAFPCSACGSVDFAKTQTRRVVKLPPAARFNNALATDWDRRAESIRTNHPGTTDETIGMLLGQRTAGQFLMCNLTDDVGIHVARCPYGQPGDQLWVREAWRVAGIGWVTPPVEPVPFADIKYRADDAEVEELRCPEEFYYAAEGRGRSSAWRPSGHMPRWASRITLEITDVRVERLQAMRDKPKLGEADALAEGLTFDEDLPGESFPRRYGLPGDLISGNNASRTPWCAFQKLWDSINAKRGYGWEKNPFVWVLEFRRLA